MKRDNMFCYRHILAVDPSYSTKNGTGYAIFDHETKRLKRCGLIRPFAQGFESYASTFEIAKKLRIIWEEEVGFSYDPEILCIEYPQTCFIRKGIRINTKSIIMLAVLCTRIEDSFKAKIPLRLAPAKRSKEQTREIVLNNLDARSKKLLESGLAGVPPHLHHNVFDAIGLGLWALSEKDHESKTFKEWTQLKASPGL